MNKKIFKVILFFTFFAFILVGCDNTDLNKEIKSSNNTESANLLIAHYIDVGQGDSILLQVNNNNILIDAGTNECEDKLLSYLKSKSIENLDYVIATHPHEDHIGSMDAIIKHFDVKNFYAPKINSNTNSFKNMVKSLKSKNLKINVAKSGVFLDLGKDTTCEFIAPNRTKYESLNDYSAVLKVKYKNTSFLFTGDAETLSEKEILNKKIDISADVLKVGHHGSNSSTSKKFLSAVSPKIAVISCGKGNDYRHPHKEPLKRLKDINCKIYRTDLDGTIVLVSDGAKIVRN